MPSKKPKPKLPRVRFALRLLSIGLTLLFIGWVVAGCWYVRHHAGWLEAQRHALPTFLTENLERVGNHTTQITDALGLTGQDATCAIDRSAPTNNIFFAGPPVRTGSPAPQDIQILMRGEFAVGYSPSLRHGVWAAYAVPASAPYKSSVRPNFKRDKSVKKCPPASAYVHSGYDRGHLAPNHAIASRFGKDAQEKTFLMTNIFPQAPALNRGPWREMEQRITELWASCYGDVWVLTGNLSPADAHARKNLPGTNIDVPTHCWMVIVAQQDSQLRALAVIMPQATPYDFFPTHAIITIDELEALTGWDFLAQLPEKIQKPLESARPTRLWPIRFTDVVKLIRIRML